MANKVIQLNDGAGNNLYPAIVAGQNKPSVDYIVEQGTRYTKWASGRAECWGSSTLASGSTSRTVSASLDVSMVGNYFVNVTPYLNGSIVDKIWCGSIGGNNTKSSEQFDISAITNTSSYSVGVDWRAIGRWK